MTDKLAPSERHKYTFEGRTIYEWEQTFCDLNVFVQVPPGTRARDLRVNVETRHIKFGLGSNPPYLDSDLMGPVKTSESFWTLEDGTLHLTLQKLEQGEMWPCIFRGHELDPIAQEQERKRLLLERFQQENPGFDFSGATFSGDAPNARTFMGGTSSFS